MGCSRACECEEAETEEMVVEEEEKGCGGRVRRNTYVAAVRVFVVRCWGSGKVRVGSNAVE